MFGIFDHPVNRALFCHRPLVEHKDVVTDVVSRGQIMGDVENGNAKVAVERTQAFQNCGAQRGIHHRDRLIGDDQLGFGEQRTRHHNPLPLPTAQLVGKAPQGLFGPQPNPGQRLFDQGAGCLFGISQFELGNRHGQHMVNRVKRIVDRKGILKDRLHLTAKLHLLGPRQRCHCLALIKDFATAGREKAQQDQGQCRLAAATFTSNRAHRRLRGINRQRKVVERNRALFVEKSTAKNFRDIP